MFIELLDLLRCINVHEETWLVASLKAISNRFVLDGTLGCPVCHAEYRIKKGIADFTQTGELVRESLEPSPPSGNREEVATRVGAFLNATEPGATLVLGGSWAEAAQELSVMTATRILALNPSKQEESETVGLLRVNREIPLAPASVLGVALDASFAPEIISSALKVVRAGGRIVAPAEIEPPGELAVLARDERYWVGEKPAEMISLRRSRISE
ncbi:MAG TPA: hypothetical protein VGJ62_15210 [Gemmatimonadaceae bacterium]